MHSDHKPLLKRFTGHPDSKKCNTLGLEAAAIPRHAKVEHIKGIANVLAVSASKLRAVGLYHDLNTKDHQQEFISPFEPWSPVEQVTDMPIQVNEIFIAPDIEKLATNYDTLHDLPTVQTDNANLSLENASPAAIPHLEQNLMSLQEFTPEKVVKLQKNKTFSKNILEHIHIHCSKNDNYFTDVMGILHQKVIDLTSTFSASVVPLILIKYLLHTSHNSLGHTGAMKLYHFIKCLYYCQGMRKKIYQYVRLCHKFQIMNFQKHFINLPQDIAETLQIIYPSTY